MTQYIHRYPNPLRRERLLDLSKARENTESALSTASGQDGGSPALDTEASESGLMQTPGSDSQAA